MFFFFFSRTYRARGLNVLRRIRLACATFYSRANDTGPNIAALSRPDDDGSSPRAAKRVWRGDGKISGEGAPPPDRTSRFPSLFFFFFCFFSFVFLFSRTSFSSYYTKPRRTTTKMTSHIWGGRGSKKCDSSCEEGYELCDVRFITYARLR